jgi:putative transcriptional regulator
MNEKDFNNLVASVKEAGKIKRGEMTPGRVQEFNPADIRAIRKKSSLKKTGSCC